MMIHKADLQYLKESTRSIQNYPKPGIVFRDLTTIFQDPKAMSMAIKAIEGLITKENEAHSFEKCVGIEARGFVLAGALAGRLNCGVVLARKPDKLPHVRIRKEYLLEYGEDALEMHVDAIQPGDKVIVIDDLLATGGTAEAACQLVEELGGEVEKVVFLVELPDLEGRKKLEKYTVESVITFEGE